MESLQILSILPSTQNEENVSEAIILYVSWTLSLYEVKVASHYDLASFVAWGIKHP